MEFVGLSDNNVINEFVGLEMPIPAVDTDKLCYEIFSILESKFLFGYDDPELWIEPPVPLDDAVTQDEGVAGKKKKKNQRGRVCILSIDGSGMRSVLSGKVLSYLEMALKNKSGNPDARISDYFDVAAGTGAGGIFAAMLFAYPSPIFSAEDTWKFIASEGKNFFRPTRKCNFMTNIFKRAFKKNSDSGSSAAAVLKAAFIDSETGRQLTLKNTIKPVLIPCYDLSSAAPFLFSRADALESDSFDFNLWEVCMATSASPGVTGPVCMKSVDGLTQCVGLDGGLAMTNPTAAAITHVLHNKHEFPLVKGLEDILVLSVGSGRQLPVGSFEYEKVRKWRATEWAQPLSRIAGDCSTELVDHAVAHAFGLNRTTNYLRVQENGSLFNHCAANVDSDPSPSNVKTLLDIADEMLHQKNTESVLFGGKTNGEKSNIEKLDWFAEQLVKEHQKRNCRIAPTVAFKQATSKHHTDIFE